MFEVRGGVKSFDGFHALDGLDMTIPGGAIYGLVGPNGAGKSTIIRHLTGAYRQDAGTILYGGAPIYENPPVKARIVSIPDELFFYLQASTRDMMRLYKGIYSSFDEALYRRLAQYFPIDEKLPLRRLSKGMQKQSAFWLALSCRPDFLVLDEPVDGLDPVMRRQVWSLIMADVAERGTTVLVSSHNLRELEDVCDHVGIMNKGRIMIERSLSDLQGGITKAQLAFEDEMPPLPRDLAVLHSAQVGRVHTLIVRGAPEAVTERLSALAPQLLDAIPLTLEEIIINELGGADYAVKDIL
jgi:ABC-2 type transport system ATP-binding protein